VKPFSAFFLWTVLFAFDRITKAIAIHTLSSGSSLPLFSFLGIDFSLTLTTNYGAAWGLLTHWPTLLLFIRLAFIVLLLYLYCKANFSKTAKISLLLILAGACSNIIDTLLWKHVVDMIHVRFWGWNYPVFNIADSWICLGALGILCSSFFHDRVKQ